MGSMRKLLNNVTYVVTFMFKQQYSNKEFESNK